jgi:hypothetical protein
VSAGAGSWRAEAGGPRGIPQERAQRGQWGPGRLGVGGVAGPNTCPEGGCQGLFTIFQASFARVWIRDDPRLLSAWREADSLYGVRSCQHRKSMRIHLNASARTAVWWALPWSRCCW